MGVHGLWKLLEPTAKPVQLEALRGKKLAIDASIWIYHFLKAMRDPNGTILYAAHIIGFFRRICKLLFFEIKPVFVFDGLPPILKKQTTERRSERRYGREQTARATANKLLTIQLERAAKMATQSNSTERQQQQQGQRHQGDYVASADSFVKSDQYHLPQIDIVGPHRADDERFLTNEEMEDYSNQFTSQARLGFIDTSLVDFESPEFERLPIETKYQLLNMARLKSRLRMGYTADELNQMFPNEMDFSKFQINRVTQRNFFTQRLMNLVGLEDDLTRRVSSEKNKEYVLKNTSGGWSLSLEDRHNDDKNDDDDDDDDGFEEVDLDPEPQQLPEQVEQQEEPVTNAINDSDLFGDYEKSSADVNKLFGFEDVVSRNNLYHELGEMEESDTEEMNVAKGKSVLFDEPESEGEKEGTDVPWFNQPLGDVHNIPDEYESSDVSEDHQYDPMEMEHEEHKELEVELEKEHENNRKDEQKDEPVVEHVAQKKKLVEPDDVEHAQEHGKEQEQEHGKEQEPKEQSHEDTKLQTAEEREPKGHGKQIEPKKQAEDPPLKEEPIDEERAEADAQIDAEENEEIAGLLIAEEEENERFAKELSNQTNRKWTDTDSAEYSQKINKLKKQFAQQTRDSDNVTNEMIQECQHLLQLFGIPYITAPAEAEAQCAELRTLKLVDGVVTDDGDTFLFDNNPVVYRNMFSQAKFVEQYNGKDIVNKLGLDRAKLIDLAFLLGSDYTEGVLGIGPVIGVEIIAEFGNLTEFAKWWNKSQKSPDDADVSSPLKRRLLKQFRTKLFLPEGFPSRTVIDAYLHPAVDKDATKFRWGEIKLDDMREYMLTAAGWDVEKTNNTLLPVINELKRRDLQNKTSKSFSQSNLNDYYSTVVQNPAFHSKRANKATEKLRSKRQKK